MMPHIKRLLGFFHHRVVRRLLVNFPRQQADGTWEYPPLGDAMREAGIEEIKTYIYRRNNAVLQYIATHPILELCLEEEGRSGSRVPNQWWDHNGLILPRRQAVGTGEEKVMGKENKEGKRNWKGKDMGRGKKRGGGMMMGGGGEETGEWGPSWITKRKGILFSNK